MTNNNLKLKEYIESQILPLYSSHDKGHGPDHVSDVIRNSMEICPDYPVDPLMVYTIAAYHDVGISQGRETHHLSSAKILREDRTLREFFTAEQIETMAQAVEDHRASKEQEPRSIYGKIVGEADRIIDPEITVFRCMEYSKKNFPDYSFSQHCERTRQHIENKYGENGYLKLWLHCEKNEKGLKALRELLHNPEALAAKCKELY